MEGLLMGRLALVTGAGSGIGQGIARGMAQAGARVHVVDIDGEAAVRTAKSIGGDAQSFTCDVTDRAQCDALADTLRRESGADLGSRQQCRHHPPRHGYRCQRAAPIGTPRSPSISTAPTTWRQRSSQLKETKGAVINIGSIQSFVALPNSAAYTTSKGGVRALTKALAIELSPLGMRVNAIGPGLIATPLNAKARENPDYMKNFEGRIPLGRIGTPEDIAPVAVFLASDMARYITGVTLPVDGGYLAY